MLSIESEPVTFPAPDAAGNQIPTALQGGVDPQGTGLHEIEVTDMDSGNFSPATTEVRLDQLSTGGQKPPIEEVPTAPL